MVNMKFFSKWSKYVGYSLGNDKEVEESLFYPERPGSVQNAVLI